MTTTQWHAHCTFMASVASRRPSLVLLTPGVTRSLDVRDDARAGFLILMVGDTRLLVTLAFRRPKFKAADLQTGDESGQWSFNSSEYTSFYPTWIL